MVFGNLAKHRPGHLGAVSASTRRNGKLPFASAFNLRAANKSDPPARLIFHRPWQGEKRKKRRRFTPRLAAHRQNSQIGAEMNRKSAGDNSCDFLEEYANFALLHFRT
jgi:hypothetical protein